MFIFFYNDSLIVKQKNITISCSGFDIISVVAHNFCVVTFWLVTLKDKMCCASILSSGLDASSSKNFNLKGQVTQAPITRTKTIMIKMHALDLLKCPTQNLPRAHSTNWGREFVSLSLSLSGLCDLTWDTPILRGIWPLSSVFFI